MLNCIMKGSHSFVRVKLSNDLTLHVGLYSKITLVERKITNKWDYIKLRNFCTSKESDHFCISQKKVTMI